MSFNTPGLDAPFLYNLLLSHLGWGAGEQSSPKESKGSVKNLALVQILLICVSHFIKLAV